jgi:two-component system, LytTR family, response regulator
LSQIAATPRAELRVLIVDDERLARDKLRRFLAEEEAVRVVGEAASGVQAVELIRQEHPDVIFLDVQMPGMDGFYVIEKLWAEPLPAVVFVTAFDEYAIRAFDVEAIDYLLKPFDRLRLRQAIDRVRRQLGQESRLLMEKLQRVLGRASDGRPPLRRIAVRSGGRIQSLNIDEAYWFEGADNYVRIHTAKTTHLVRETLSVLERRLDPAVYIRIHRSAIVRIDTIREVESLFHGQYEVVLAEGQRLPVGRKYWERLLEAMGGRV